MPPHSNSQRARTLQEATTTLSPPQVVAAAKTFFGKRSGIYAAFLEKEGPGYATFRGQGGEEIVVGTSPADGGTRVSASTYLFDQQVARFLSSLPREDSLVGPAVEAVAVDPA